MYKISEFAEMTGLTKETLRYYAEVKLLEPAFIDPNNNYGITMTAATFWLSFY